MADVSHPTGTHNARVRHYRDGAMVLDQTLEIPTDPRRIAEGQMGPEGGWTDETRPEYCVIDYAAFGTAIYFPLKLKPGEDHLLIRPATLDDMPDEQQATDAPAPG